MITILSSKAAPSKVVDGATKSREVLCLVGLSSDTKPTTSYKGILICNGSVYDEIDTGKEYLYDEAGGEWHEQPEGDKKKDDPTAEEISVSRGSADAGKVIVVGEDGKLLPVDLDSTGAVAIDRTLKVSGAAADAKETGDAIRALNGSLDTLINAINAVPTETASGSIASFSDGADDIPVKNLTVNIDSVQSGTGDPSPDNVRPISGWTGAKITCNNETINIDWTNEAGTVYGGTLDVANGKLTVDMAMVDLGTLKWYYFARTNPPHFGADVSGIKSRTNNLLCSNYATVENNPYTNAYGTIRATLEHSSNGIKISDTAYTDTNAFTAAMSGVQLVYELANPITYQLTPQEVKTILGENNIFADTGDVSVEYRADIKKYIDKVVATAVSALS